MLRGWARHAVFGRTGHRVRSQGLAATLRPPARAWPELRAPLLRATGVLAKVTDFPCGAIYALITAGSYLLNNPSQANTIPDSWGAVFTKLQFPECDASRILQGAQEWIRSKLEVHPTILAELGCVWPYNTPPFEDVDDPSVIHGLRVLYLTSGEYSVIPKWSHLPAPIASRIAFRIASSSHGDGSASCAGFGRHLCILVAVASQGKRSSSIHG